LWGCRAAKASNLARYAALYCDSVIVPVRLNQHATAETDDFYFKEALAGSILCLQEFRPASEAGILNLVPDTLHFCSDCARDATERFTSTEKTAENFLLRNQEKFSVEYEPADSEMPLPRLQIKGPEEYIDHGRVIRLYWQEPDWIRSLGVGGAPKSRYRLSPLEVEKSGVVKSILSELSGDAAFQQAYSIKYGAKCLTDLPAQAEVLNIFNEDQRSVQRISSLLAGITHSVPILSELPTANALRIRKEEPDAFLRYRAALGRILMEYTGAERTIGPSEAKEIYADVLLPEILRLRLQAKNYRRSKLSATIKKCTFSAMVVTMGFFGGLPVQVAAALKAAGATNLLRDLHDAVGETAKAKSDIKNESLYFLVRVLDEAE